MGILSDIFISTDQQVQLLASDQSPIPTLPGIVAKSIDPVKLAKLWCLLTKQRFSLELIDDFLLVRELSTEGPWIFRLPADLANKLIGQQPEHILQLGQAWAVTTAEFQLDGWATSDVIKLLQDMFHLAKRAAQNKEQLYLCNSL